MNMVVGGMGPYEHSVTGPQPSQIFPLAGSCICCERDETAASEETMKRCSKCKLTRYAECLHASNLNPTAHAFQRYCR